MTAITRLDRSSISLAATMPSQSNFREVVVHRGQTDVIEGLKSFVRMKEFEINEAKDTNKDFLDEYAYVLLSKAILQTAYDLQVKKIDADVADYVRADYRTSKQILRRMETLKNDLDAFCDKYFFLNKKVAHKCEQMLNVVMCLNEVGAKKNKLQLLYLAYYILKMRFMPLRKKIVVSDRMKWIIDKKGQLMGLIELIDTTSDNNEDERMASIAKMVINV